RPRLRRETRALSQEVEMHALDEPQLLAVEPEIVAPPMQLVDALEEPGIEVDGSVMRCKTRRHLALDRLQRRRRLRCGQVEEDALDALEGAAAAVERGQRVVERRGFRLLRYRVDLRAMGAHRAIERGSEMRGLDRIERRQAVRRLPRLQEGIAVVIAHGPKR